MWVQVSPPEVARKREIISEFMNHEIVKTPAYVVELAKDLRNNMTVSEENYAPSGG